MLHSKKVYVGNPAAVPQAWTLESTDGSTEADILTLHHFAGVMKAGGSAGKAALRLLSAYPDRVFTLDELAERCEVSSTHLNSAIEKMNNIARVRDYVSPISYTASGDYICGETADVIRKGIAFDDRQVRE